MTGHKQQAERPRIDVVAGILWREGCYLGVRRPKGKPMAGFWEFPGGKVEAGEELEAALLRELQEELGVTIQAASFWRTAWHDYEHLSVRLHFFHVQDWTGEPHPHEGHELRWLRPEAGEALPFLEADLEIVRELARF